MCAGVARCGPVCAGVRPRFPQGSPKVPPSSKSLRIPKEWRCAPVCADVRLGCPQGAPKVPPQGKVSRKVPPRFPQGSPKASGRLLAPLGVLLGHLGGVSESSWEGLGNVSDAFWCCLIDILNLGSVFEAIWWSIEKPCKTMESISKIEVRRVTNAMTNWLGRLPGTNFDAKLACQSAGSWRLSARSWGPLGGILGGSWEYFGDSWRLFGRYIGYSDQATAGGHGRRVVLLMGGHLGPGCVCDFAYGGQFGPCYDFLWFLWFSMILYVFL